MLIILIQHPAIHRYSDEVEALLKRDTLDDKALQMSFLESLQIEKYLLELNQTDTTPLDYVKQANATRSASLSAPPRWSLQNDFEKSPRRALNEHYPASSAAVEEAVAVLSRNNTLQVSATYILSYL